MKHIMRTQINVARYGTANKWSTICNCKTMIHIMQLQTNELHYATVKNVEHAASANKWSTICNCKTNERHYAPKKRSTLCDSIQMKNNIELRN